MGYILYLLRDFKRTVSFFGNEGIIENVIYYGCFIKFMHLSRVKYGWGTMLEVKPKTGVQKSK